MLYVCIIISLSLMIVYVYYDCICLPYICTIISDSSQDLGQKWCLHFSLDCLTHWCELRHTPQGSLVAPTSLAFSVDGERLHCGLHNSIKTFSTSRPGGAGVTRPLPRFGAVSCVTPHPSVLGVSALGSRTGGGESMFKCMASDSLVPRPILWLFEWAWVRG